MYDHIGSALLIYMMDFQKYDINSNEKRVAYAIQMKEMGLKIAQYIQKKKKNSWLLYWYRYRNRRWICNCIFSYRIMVYEE